MSQPRLTLNPAEQRADRLKTMGVLVMLLVIAGCFIAGLLYENRKAAELAVYSHYTVGQVIKTGYVLGPSPERSILFTYQVGDSTYRGNDAGDLPDGQTRLLVRFSTKHPSYYESYKEAVIPNSIQIVPSRGWVQPPVELPDYAH